MEFNIGDEVYVFAASGLIKKVTIFRIDNYVGEDWYNCEGWLRKIYLKYELFATKEEILKHVISQLEKI